MKVSWLNSLGGKLFFLMGVCLLATVAAISWQNVRMFLDVQSNSLRDNTTAQAKESAGSLTSVIENWTSQIAILMHSMAGASPDEFQRHLNNFLRSNKEFVAVDIFIDEQKLGKLASAFSESVGDLRFEDKSPAAVRQVVNKAAYEVVRNISSKQKTSVQMHLQSLIKESQLPLAQAVMMFSQNEQDKKYWVVLTVWQTRLIAALPNSKSVHSTLATIKGATILSTNAADLGQRTALAKIFAKEVATHRSPDGFRAYNSADGAPKLSAYAQIPAYNFMVIVTRDATSAYMTMHNIVFKTARWAWVFLLAAIMVSYLAVSGTTKHLKILTETTVEIARGNFLIRPRVTGRDEVGILSGAVDYMSAQIQLLLKAKIDAARQEKELETAKIVQETLFPRSDINSAYLKITGHCSPASECGGDWWGHFETDDGLHYILIADATGHGAAAAIVTAMAHSSCMTLAESYKKAGSARLGPAHILTILNRILWETGNGRNTMTFLAMMIDPKRNTMTFASAGHCMPYLLPANKADSRLKKDRRHLLLRCQGSPLGYEANSVFKEYTENLKAGEKIFLYTDGLIECVDEHFNAFGKRQLEKVLTQSADMSAAEVKVSVLNSAFKHFGQTPLNDDITVVAIDIGRAKGTNSISEPARKVG